MATYYGSNSIEADGSFYIHLPDSQYCGVQITGQATGDSYIEVWGNSNKSRVEIDGNSGILVRNDDDPHVRINNDGVFAVYGKTIRATDGSESNGHYTRLSYDGIRWNYNGMGHGWTAIMDSNGVLIFTHDGSISS